MAKTSAPFQFNSLKGKIQLATTALAFFVGFFGLISYAITALAGSSFYAVFFPFVFLAVTIVFFGRWLASEIASPVEKVSLLAKSFERGVSTTLPKTSGSIETDELAQTIARLGEQVQKLVASMDEVASGNLNVVFSPAATGSDRVSQTFQKLLAKVSESIHAKQDLERLRNIVLSLSEEVSPVKNENLDVKIKTDSPETKEISQAFGYLTDRLCEIANQFKTEGAEARNLAAEIQKMIQAIVLRDETKVQEMSQASVTLKRLPNTIQKIYEELEQSSFSANQSIEKARTGTGIAQENLNAVGSLRRQIQEAIKHIRGLNERSQEINKVVKMVADLAQRTNMVALNASVQANELGEAGRGFVVVSEEVQRLAERAGNTTKHISSLNKTFQADIDEAENALQATAGEAARLSKFAIETGGALGELEKYVTGVLNLQNKIVSFSREQTDETEQAFQIFVKGISETEKSLTGLKASASVIDKISGVMEDLQSAVSDFKVPAAAAGQPAAEEPKSPQLAAAALIEQPVPFITFGEDSL